MTAPAATPGVIWRNRIVGSGEIDPRSLIPNPKNWRIHPQFQQAAVLALLEEVGVVQDIIVNRGTATIIDGHLRVSLALQTGQPTIPVKWVDLTGAEEDLVLLQIDPLAALATTNTALLAELIAGAQTTQAATLELLESMRQEWAIPGAAGPAGGVASTTPGAAVDATGADLLAPGRPEQAQAVWGTAAGQIWEIAGAAGTHRVRCGDSADAAGWRALLEGLPVQLLLTSPPYGVGMEYEDVAGDFSALQAVVQQVFATAAPWVAQNGFAFINFANRFTFPKLMGQEYLEIFTALGWRWYDYRYWKRSQAAMRIWNTTQPRAMNQVEELFTFQRGETRYPVHDLEISKHQLWEAPGGSAHTGHPAVMPVGLAEQAIQIYSDRGEAILDPFGGILTTVLAAERTGRIGAAQEKEPGYVALGLQRCTDLGLGVRCVAGPEPQPGPVAPKAAAKVRARKP